MKTFDEWKKDCNTDCVEEPINDEECKECGSNKGKKGKLEEYTVNNDEDENTNVFIGMARK